MALIRTPHAAVKIWNFNDRLNAKGLSGTFDAVNELIISTVSLVSISTHKTKSEPAGSFNFSLAPTRNWTSVITPGSWCAILMSNEPITEKIANTAASSKHVKMFGRIESVRVDVTVGEDGTRQTKYVVSGQDWGSIFNNMVYVDPIIIDPSDQSKNQANALYQQFVENIFSDQNDPHAVDVPTNLYSIMSIIGGAPKLPKTDRLAKATHDVSIPSDLSTYFNFIDGTGSVNHSTKFTDLITLVWGPLKDLDDYDQSNGQQTGLGWLDPFSMVGQHSLWSILQENSNYAMNEMFPEMFWPSDDGGPQLLLYNRIKPFAYTDQPASTKIDTSMRSLFKNIAFHKLDTEAISSADAGLNWRDKYNFIEIKPDINELSVLGVLLKARSQAYQGGNTSSDIFNREGFRPMIYSIKQLPFTTNGTSKKIDDDVLEKWTQLAQEWFFDSHRLLNGRVVLQGSSEYIPVGDNIMFDASLIGATPNYNSAAVGKTTPIYVLGHVESVQNSFSVSGDGTRTFQTTIQYVRGIIVDESRNLIGEGTIDSLASALKDTASQNVKTVYSKATDDVPKNPNEPGK